MNKEAETIFYTIDHFITGGWPIRVRKTEAKVLKKFCPYFTLTNVTHDPGDDRTVHVTLKQKIPSHHLITYYQIKIKEVEEEYRRLYQSIAKIVND